MGGGFSRPTLWSLPLPDGRTPPTPSTPLTGRSEECDRAEQQGFDWVWGGVGGAGEEAGGVLHRTDNAHLGVSGWI